MLVVAAQAAWGLTGTWEKLKADRREWLKWEFLIESGPPGFVARVQVISLPFSYRI